MTSKYLTLFRAKMYSTVKSERCEPTEKQHDDYHRQRETKIMNGHKRSQINEDQMRQGNGYSRKV